MAQNDDEVKAGQIQESKAKRFIWWLAGGLLLAIVGNAMWEVTKPGLIWIGKGILSIATLGMQSLIDGLYADIAKGNFDWFGMWLSNLSISMITVFLMMLVFLAATLHLLRKHGTEKVREKMPLLRAADEIFSSNWTLGIYVCTMLVLVTVQGVRISYIHRAANYADQLQRIVSPYVSEKEALLYDSRFAQVQTRGEYVRLIEELRSIAKRHNAAVPDFDIF